jgi:hypothetical protein
LETLDLLPPRQVPPLGSEEDPLATVLETVVALRLLGLKNVKFTPLLGNCLDGVATSPKIPVGVVVLITIAALAGRQASATPKEITETAATFVVENNFKLGMTISLLHSK